MWNKFQEVHKNTPNRKPQLQNSEGKRKCSRKGKLKNEEESHSEQSSSKTQWKELTQHFRLNDSLNLLLKRKEKNKQTEKHRPGCGRGEY